MSPDDRFTRYARNYRHVTAAVAVGLVLGAVARMTGLMGDASTVDLLAGGVVLICAALLLVLSRSAR